MVLLPESRPALQPIVLAPDTAACPRCRTLCPRHERVVMHRQHGVLEGRAEQQKAIAGAYLCPNCPKGQRWFRLDIPGFHPKRRYTPSTRRALKSLVRTYNLSFIAAAHFGRNELGLTELHHSTLVRWFCEEGDALDYQAHLQQALSCFSGQLAVDELYDGRYHVLKVTDPVNNIEITSWLGMGSPDADDIRALFGELKEAGFEPVLVVTDGSSLYPGPLAELWPEAEHQLCVFHFVQGALVDLAKTFWRAFNTMPAPIKRGRGRPKKRGRPRKDKDKRKNRKLVRSSRYLLFKRGGVDERGQPLLTEAEQQLLQQVQLLCPALRVLRRFVAVLYALLSAPSVEEAQRLRQVVLEDEDFRQDKAMAKVVARLADDALWKGLTRHYDYDGAHKTSNHVERANREHRRRQRSHYRLRCIRSLWALLNITISSRPIPSKPFRLTRRRPSDDQQKEVRAA